MVKVSIAEAAHRLGISQDTVRKRLRLGELRGEQISAPGGFRWLIEVPPDEGGTEIAEAPSELDEVLRDVIRRQDETMNQLREQLSAKDQQISELHVLLQQAQAALPAPRNNQPWWRFW
jgi:hypothetical protein